MELFNPELKSNRNALNQTKYIIDGKVRRALSEVDPETEYTFLHTSANPEAVKVVQEYVVDDKSWRPRKKKDKVTDEMPFSDEVKGIWYTPRTHEAYHIALETMAESLGMHASYPIVSTEGVHNLHVPSESVMWPQVHAIEACDKEAFVDLVNNMNSSDTLDVMREIEATHFYDMRQAEILNERGINPLILGHEWDTDGETILKSLNFMQQFRLGETKRLSFTTEY